MARNRRRNSANIYRGIEPGLSEANRRYIRYDRSRNHRLKIVVLRIVKKIITAMKKESPNVFAKLHPKIFGGGSSFEGLKIGEGGDFDIDVLFKLPKKTVPRLREDNIPGYVQLQLEKFHDLARNEPELYRAMHRFVDDQNYLLADRLKSTLMQSIFDRTMNRSFPGGVIRVLGGDFRIDRVRAQGPASTLSIECANLSLEVDLVPCILLSEKYWPQGGFRSNPYVRPNAFFLVPKLPNRERTHIGRYFRLSFQMQEREIFRDRYWLKPTIRIMKLIRDRFNHGVSSYAIKTLFMWELHQGNAHLDGDTPQIWKGPFSFCLIHMLEKYVQCLGVPKISYFWHSKLNLLDNLSVEQINECKRDIGRLLERLRADPSSETFLRYLE